MMTSDSEGVLTKGAQLKDQITALSAELPVYEAGEKKLILSFDLFCVLVEYTSLIGQLRSTEPQTVEQLITYDELVFDTGAHELPIAIDFFSPPDTLRII